MGKYAVTVGVNYTKSPKYALKGCINDSHIMRSILLAKGFDEENIKMLNDEDAGAEAPSGANVRKALDWLCSDRSADDVIFFHFSGHGTQIPSDGDDLEVDGMDEALCMEELFLYADDDFKMHFSKLPEGCQATVITDCCHSGGMLDHTEVAIEGDKKYDAGETCGEAPDYSKRSLPISTVASFLSDKLGKPVEPNSSGIGGAQASFFGGDAGKLAMKFAASQMKGGGGGGGNPLAALLGGGGDGEGGGGGGGAMAIAGMAAAALAKGGGENPLTAILSELGLGGMKSATGEGAPPYVPTENPLSGDCGILVTGCQSDQTSADVRPRGGKPYGALSNAIKTCFNQNPNATYREIVLAVRSQLQISGFSQNPQLECSGGNADLPFICESGGAAADEAEEVFSGGGPMLGGLNLRAGDSSPVEGEGGASPPDAKGGLAALFKACFKG